MTNQKYDPNNPDENQDQISGHWEKYASKHYMGASALYISKGRYAKIKVTIVGVYRREVYDKATRGKKPVVVAALQGKEEIKDMILNLTNMARLEKLIGSPEIDHWVGKVVPLGAEYVNAGKKGKVWALRFNPQ